METLDKLALGLGWSILIIATVCLGIAYFWGLCWGFIRGRKRAWSWLVAARLMRKYRTDQAAVRTSLKRAHELTNWRDKKPDFTSFVECLKHGSDELDKISPLTEKSESVDDEIDLHTREAMRAHGVKESEVTEKMRRQAKRVNFGIAYGARWV